MPKIVQKRKEEYKRKNNKRHHAQEEEEEPPKKSTNEEIEGYILFSALYRSVTLGNDTCLFDNGASKHMTCQKKTLSSI